MEIRDLNPIRLVRFTRCRVRLNSSKVDAVDGVTLYPVYFEEPGQRNGTERNGHDCNNGHIVVSMWN